MCWLLFNPFPGSSEVPVTPFYLVFSQILPRLDSFLYSCCFGSYCTCFVNRILLHLPQQRNIPFTSPPSPWISMGRGQLFPGDIVSQSFLPACLGISPFVGGYSFPLDCL